MKTYEIMLTLLTATIITALIYLGYAVMGRLMPLLPARLGIC